MDPTGDLLGDAARQRIVAGESTPRPGTLPVVGTCGAGKTTVARALAGRLDLQHVELDALSWGPNWTPQSAEVFRLAVSRAVAADRWVVDGNYSTCRDIVWARAETIVWLDYRFARTFAQLLARTFRRALRREVLWNDNRESLRTAFFSRDSILLWAITTHARRKREYAGLFAQPDNARLRVIRLRSPREATAWLGRLAGDAVEDRTSPTGPGYPV